MSYRRQYLSVVCGLSLFLIDGCQIGWLSPTISKLKDAKSSPLGRAATDEEISTLGVVSSMFFIGTIFSGFINNTIGRKRLLIICCVLFLISWTGVGFANNIVVLILSRFLGAQAVGLLTPTLVTYLIEITSVHTRGSALASSGILINGGILLMYILGTVMAYRTLAFVAIGLTFIVLICICCIVESPVFHMKRGNKSEALKSIAILNLSQDLITPPKELKNMLGDKAKVSLIPCNKDENYIDTNGLKDIKKPDENVVTSHDIESVANKKITKNNWALVKDLFLVKNNRNALIIAVTVNLAQQFSGILPVLLFASRIFEISGSSVPPHIATIIFGIIQLFSIGIGNVAINHFGRRTLILASCGATIVSNLVLGTHLYLESIHSPITEYISWLPLANTLFFIVVYCVGLGTTTMLLTGELFDNSIRSFGSALTLLINNITSVLVISLYAVISLNLGEYLPFWLFSLLSSVCFVVVYYRLPETRGKKMCEIQDAFR